MPPTHFNTPNNIDLTRLNQLLATYRLAPINIDLAVNDINRTRRMGRSRARAITRWRIQWQIRRVNQIITDRTNNRNAMWTWTSTLATLSLAHNRKANFESLVNASNNNINNIDQTIAQLTTAIDDGNDIQQQIVDASSKSQIANTITIPRLTNERNILQNNLNNLVSDKNTILNDISTATVVAVVNNLHMKLNQINQEITIAQQLLNQKITDLSDAEADKIINENLANNLRTLLAWHKTRYGAIGRWATWADLHDIIDDLKMDRDRLVQQRDSEQLQLDLAEQEIVNNQHLSTINIWGNDDDHLLRSYLGELEEGLRTINGSSISHRFKDEIRRLFGGN